MMLGLSDLFTVKGKVALVTGGARGLGLMMTQGLLENGVKVYIASRKTEMLDQAVRTLGKYGPVFAIEANLAETSGVECVAEALAARESKLDILVNNAGAMWQEPLETYSESGWDRVMDLNVKSVFFLIQKLLPLLRAAATAEDPARIVNIGSVSGFAISPRQAYAYVASKAALHHMTRNLAGELGESHITVNVIAPGPFETDMLAPLLRGRREEMLSAVRLGRFGTPEDIVGTLIFLCGRAGAFLTGAVLPLDGGRGTTL